MKYNKALLKEIIPDDLEHNRILIWFKNNQVTDVYVHYDPFSKKRKFIGKLSILGRLGNPEHRRELTIKEQFLIRVML